MPAGAGKQVETEFPFCVNLEHSFHSVQTARKIDAYSRLAARPDRGPGGLFAVHPPSRPRNLSPATVAAAAETAPTAEDGANGVAIWVHPQDGAKSLILGAGGTGGLEVYGLDGALRQRIGDLEASHVTVRYNFDLGGRKVPLVIAYEPTRSALIGYTIDESTQLIRLPGEPIIADDELTGLCSFQSPITGRVYALGMTDGGQMLQWQLFACGRRTHGAARAKRPAGQRRRILCRR